jgi:hypothetical protein
LRFLQRVGYATVGIEICGIPPFAKSAKDGALGTRGFVALPAEEDQAFLSIALRRDERTSVLSQALTMIHRLFFYAEGAGLSESA